MSLINQFIINLRSNKMKQKAKLVMATLFLLMTMTVYLFAAEAAVCNDCGNVRNCYFGNGLDTGYRNCETFINPETDIMSCKVSNPCW